jgi:hypothetical protein
MKKILIFLLIVIAIGGAIGLYLYNKPHETAADVEVFQELSAQDLYQKFLKDPEAVKTYLNKNLKITGKVESYSADSTVKWIMSTQAEDMGVITVTFAEKPLQNPIIGNQVTVQGLCAGYLAGDEILGGEVQLNQAVVVEK